MVQQSLTARLPAAFATCVLVCLPLCAGAAAAPGESPAPAWKRSGFGTLGAVYADSRSADFTASVLRAWSPDVDCRLRAQLDMDLGAWSGVLQVVSEQRLDGSYRPQLDWAYINYQLTPDPAVRAGRVALPVFLGAESRKVGYTIPWVRTPVEMQGYLFSRPLPARELARLLSGSRGDAA